MSTNLLYLWGFWFPFFFLNLIQTFFFSFIWTKFTLLLSDWKRSRLKTNLIYFVLLLYPKKCTYKEVTLKKKISICCYHDHSIDQKIFSLLLHIFSLPRLLCRSWSWRAGELWRPSSSTWVELFTLRTLLCPERRKPSTGQNSNGQTTAGGPWRSVKLV